MEKSRLQNSLLNLVSGFAYRILIMLTAFVVRTVFIHNLNEDYLGINGLYSGVLSMLSLAELGFSTAMVYSMYKPLAEKDYHKLQQLAKLYRKAYQIIGTVILVLGLCLVPFLDYLIKNKPDIEGLTFYYLLFLGNSVLSYWFFAYRNSILQADQRAYVVSNYHSIFNLIKSFLQIILLAVFHNYTVYLVTQMLCTIAQNVALAIKVKRDYPFFLAVSRDTLPAEDKRAIFKDVQALMMTKVSHVVLNSSDSIIISAFVGVNQVGLLSNFNIIVEAVSGFITQITGAITASIGSFFAKESKESGYQLFQRVEFLNYWMYSFSFIALIVLLNPFVTLWIGPHFTMSNAVIIWLALRFLTTGYSNTMWTFRSTLGLFTQGKYRPLVMAILNVVLSIVLSLFWGVAGVLAGTSISRGVVNLWFNPWVLHKDGFKKPIKPYVKQTVVKLLLLSVLTIGMLFLSHFVFWNGVTWLRFTVMVCLTAIIPNSVLFLIFRKSDELQYLLGLVKGMLKKLHIRK